MEKKYSTISDTDDFQTLPVNGQLSTFDAKCITLGKASA